jgi:hypothetical protein
MRTALWRSIARISALRLFAFVLACLLVFQPAASHADIWEWFTQVVTDRTDVEDAARSGAAVPADATITGPDETRTLHFGRDVLQLYPSTVVTFQDGSKSTVRLISGTVRVKAAKRKDGKTLSVETLTLVATVKGTDFEVSAVGDVSAVSVYEGRVAVKAVGVIGGMDVTPGKTATVSARDKGGKLGNTPRGGAPEAAKQAAKGARAADAPKPSNASKQPASQSKPPPSLMGPAPKPAAAVPAADELKDKTKPGKPGKPDKKGKAGPPKPGPH